MTFDAYQDSIPCFFPDTEPELQRHHSMDTPGIGGLLFLMTTFVIVQVNGAIATPRPADFSTRPPQFQKMQAIRASFQTTDSAGLGPSPEPKTSSNSSSPLIYHVTSYGADPGGKTDSTPAILAAISAALEGPGEGFLFAGIVNLGGARIDLDGGNYLISRPLRFPFAGRGNLVIHGGSLTASPDFPSDGYLIDLSPPSNNVSAYNYEFVTLRDLLLDSNYHGGGIRVVDSLRTSIDNCYITHFNTTGIYVNGGHETYIRYSYLGQHITAGGDPGEREFSGTGIVLDGNDNSVTDVVIFSAATGIVVLGGANLISGVHCYNKATGFGGTGIYLKTPGPAQTRIVNSYMDFTGIVAEDPVQLTVSGSFFLGDAYVLFRAVNGVVTGVTVVDNMFSGSDKGVDIVQLDESNGRFNQVDQVVIDKNNARGMNLKATVARGRLEGNGSTWTADFNSVLVFPNLIKQVQYTFLMRDGSFTAHALRNVTGNRVVIQSQAVVPATVYVTVDQGRTSLSL